jgi:hypothetical protein
MACCGFCFTAIDSFSKLSQDNGIYCKQTPPEGSSLGEGANLIKMIDSYADFACSEGVNGDL